MSNISELIDSRSYIRKVYVSSIISLFTVAVLHIWTAALPKTLFFFCFGVAFTLGYFLFKNLKNQFYIKSYYILIYWIGFTSYSIYTGAIWASALVILILLPIITLGFATFRWALFILGLVSLTYILLFYLQEVVPLEIPPNRPLWIMITLITTTVVAFLFVYFYGILAYVEHKKLKLANKVLAEKQIKLDQQLQFIKTQNEQITKDKLYQEKRNENLRKYTESIVEIFRMEELYEGDFAYSIDVLLQSIRDLLCVDLVSIWQYDESKQELILISQKSTSTTSLIAVNSRLGRIEFPTYFDHVISGLIIQVDDVYTNRITQEMKNAYFERYGITSLLDCPYYVDGKFAGVICCETYQKRLWGPEDSIFIKGISNMASISLSALHKMTLIKNLEIDNLKMKQNNRELKKKISKGNEMYENLSQQIADYANINAHKLRGPVCRLLGLLELLEKSKSQNDILNIKTYLVNNINELNHVTIEFGEQLNQLEEI